MNKAVNAIFGLAALLVLYVLAQILLFATFKIPSDSMEPTLIEGDVISVCKPALGARIFNISVNILNIAYYSRSLFGDKRIGFSFCENREAGARLSLNPLIQRVV